MGIPEHYKVLAEPYKADALASLAELEKSRGSPLTDQEKDDLWENGLWRLALMRADVRLPVPESITMELVTGIPPAELSQLLWDYLCVFMDDVGCYQTRGAYRETITGLPRGLRVVHSLVVLDSEVLNGGFLQFFTNSSGGELVEETLEDLQFIGATKQAAILEEAIELNRQIEAKYPFYKNRFQDPEPKSDPESEARLWSDVETVLEPEFDRLTTEYDSASLWPAFDLYAQHHPEQFVHSRVQCE
jgi:hypothetical protein